MCLNYRSTKSSQNVILFLRFIPKKKLELYLMKMDYYTLYLQVKCFYCFSYTPLSFAFLRDGNPFSRLISYMQMSSNPLNALSQQFFLNYVFFTCSISLMRVCDIYGLCSAYQGRLNRNFSVYEGLMML